MTQHAEHIDTGWAINWSSPERGAWAADRLGRVVGEVRRDGNRYVATRGGRRVGKYRSLDDALDAVDRSHLTSVSPSRFWTLLLGTINVGFVAALWMVATAVFR